LPILDGHSSRLQRTLWEQLSQEAVDVLCIPARTSNFTQSLDMCVTAQFKSSLLQLVVFPRRVK
jgi:hypothetical protein